jgi:hypothetical protein
MFTKNENGSALAIVLILVTALTLIASIVVLAYGYHYRSARRDVNRLQARYLAEGAIYKTLWFLGGNEGRDISWRPEDYPLHIDEENTARVSVRPRGGTFEITAAVEHRNQSVELMVVAAQGLPDCFDKAIILGGRDFPIVVTGETQITGDVLVGLKGVKAGTIKGTRFKGKKLVHGRIEKNPRLQSPSFDVSVFRETIANCLKICRERGRATLLDFEADSLQLAPGTTVLVNGELDSRLAACGPIYGPLTFIAPGDLRISGSVKLLDRIIIVAGGQISIEDSALVDDALVYAGTGIGVSGQASGAMQLLTPGNIVIQDKVLLNYPSFLFAATHVDSAIMTGSITLEGDAVVQGALILAENKELLEKNIRRNSMIKVGDNAHVVGLVYSTNRTSISGTVDGMVMTDHFYFYESPTTYINWLKDARIDRTTLPEDFKIPVAFTNEPRFEILQWYERSLEKKLAQE